MGHKQTLGAQGTPRPFVLQMGRVRPTNVCGHSHDSHTVHGPHSGSHSPHPVTKTGCKTHTVTATEQSPVLLAPEGPQPELTGGEVKAPQAPPARPALGTKGASA